MDSRIFQFLLFRTALFFVFSLGFQGAGSLYWALLLFLSLSISSGWIYYFAYKNLDDHKRRSAGLVIVALIVDIFFSLRFLNGSGDLKPTLVYALSGLAVFVIVGFLNRKQ